MAKYKRVLLKLSGEALAGPKKTGLDEATCLEVARQVKWLADEGVEIGIVLAWTGQRAYRQDEGGPDWYVGYSDELYLCIRDFPQYWHENPYFYSVSMRHNDGTVFQR